LQRSKRRLYLESGLRKSTKTMDEVADSKLAAALKNQSIQKQQDHRADDGHDPACDVIVSGKNATDPGTDERASDTEKNCNDTTAWIFSWHQQFRDGAYDETDHQNPQNRVRAKVHNEPSSIGFTALRQDFKE
jgi:hypothetical protein